MYPQERDAEPLPVETAIDAAHDDTIRISGKQGNRLKTGLSYVRCSMVLESPCELIEISVCWRQVERPVCGCRQALHDSALMKKPCRFEAPARSGALSLEEPVACYKLSDP